jgi:uncharacterized protein
MSSGTTILWGDVMKILVYVAVAFLATPGLLLAQGFGGKSVPGNDIVPRQALPGDTPGTGQPGHETLPSASDYSTKILPEMKGVVSWQTLSQVMTVKVKGRYVQQFSAGVTKLDRKEVRLQGFMIPLDVGERQKRFILTAVPPSCAFCMPAGPDAMVMVQPKSPVKYGSEPVVMSGKLVVLKEDPEGLYYRLDNAVAINAR